MRESIKFLIAAVVGATTTIGCAGRVVVHDHRTTEEVVVDDGPDRVIIHDHDRGPDKVIIHHHDRGPDKVVVHHHDRRGPDKVVVHHHDRRGPDKVVIHKDHDRKDRVDVKIKVDDKYKGGKPDKVDVKIKVKDDDTNDWKRRAAEKAERERKEKDKKDKVHVKIDARY